MELMTMTNDRGRAEGGGDRGDFEGVPREHGEALLRWALQLTGDRTSACDLVQDTYERALRRGLATVPPERRRSWLFVIARNQFLDAYRSRRRRRAVSTADVLAASAAMTAGTADDEADADAPWATLGLDDLRRAVQRLSPPLAEVYRLHAFERLDYAASAGRLRIPMTTVGTRLLRARLKLRELLSQPDAGCAPLAPLRKGRTARPLCALRAA
jgi:RNA polymerase sigma-70 factor, ECF subfamily